MGELKKLRIGGSENVITPYTAGEGINIDGNRQISVDTTVVATQDEITTLQDSISDVIDDLNDKAPVIINSASGTIASFSDGAEMPVKSLTVKVEPVQAGSGDPAPDNVRPITGHTQTVVRGTGRNLFDKSDGLHGIWAGSGGNVIMTSSNAFSAIVPCMPNTTYTVSKGASARFRISDTTIYPVANASAKYLASDDSATKLTVTTHDDAKYLVIYCWYLPNDGDLTQNFLSSIQVELGSTATPYQPYKSRSITIDLDGTVYGGTLNASTGLLTVEWGSIVYDGTTSSSWGSESRGFYIENDNLIRDDINKDYTKLIKCDKLTTKTNYSATAFASTPYCITGYSANSYPGQNWIYVSKAFSGQTLSEFRTWITANPIHVVYKLATPVEIQLVGNDFSTYYGDNNIWADTGDVEVEYRADTKLYIEQLTKPTEDDMVANAAISSGKYFMVGNRLFLSTATIASGDTINPGTNCTEMSLADALNSL